ncbi:TRAP transporter large permease [Devosia sp.]|uniref:TRAP transporter large permease n=1 Tax=Devosia sp. TaxID=1871048 RepID=UPI002B001D04|nr:TRAP transporter large permease [Devosia sp.]
MIETLVGFAAFILLAFLRIPLAIAMTIVGFLGFGHMVNINASLAMVGQVTYETGLAYSLSVIPLFILMGNLIVRAKLAEELFRAAYAFVGHWRGGLAMSTIVASGGFGAICGSAIATTATFSQIAEPSMRKFGYKPSLIAGTIASGGTLGILIPPSLVFVIYGIMTEESIGKLFIAGILPGILAIGFLCGAIFYVVRRDPLAGPKGERQGWAVRLASLRRVWAVVLLFVVILGGIYAGIFTATEGAGIGAGGALIFALVLGKMRLRDLVEVFVQSATMAAGLFLILVGATIFTNFVNLTTMPYDLVALIQGANMAPVMVVLMICLVYLVLGTAMEELSMIALTVPLFYPIVTDLGYSGIWFGVIVAVVCQIGLTTPPVGINIFVVKSVMKDLPLREAFRGTWPFNAALVLLLLLLVFVPGIATLLVENVR